VLINVQISFPSENQLTGILKSQGYTGTRATGKQEYALYMDMQILSIKL
jgi:hypothetical protein